jgi:hypothetical protein
MSTFVIAAGGLGHQVDETKQGQTIASRFPCHVTKCGAKIMKGMPTSSSAPGKLCKACEKGIDVTKLRRTIRRTNKAK